MIRTGRCYDRIVREFEPSDRAAAPFGEAYDRSIAKPFSGFVPRKLDPAAMQQRPLHVFWSWLVHSYRGNPYEVEARSATAATRS